MIEFPVALVAGDTVIAIFRGPDPFRGPDGVQHPAAVWSAWSPADWVEKCPGWGLAMVEVDAVPDRRLFDLGGETITLVDGVVHIGRSATRKPAETIQLILTDYLAERRWRAEIQGCTWNGWEVSTDRDSQSKYAGELLAVTAGIRVDGSLWKFGHGFEPLTNAQVLELATAARAHVLACYALEGSLSVQIAGDEITTFAAIDAAFAENFPLSTEGQSDA